MCDINETEDTAAIVARYASGQDQAFGELYRRFKEKLIRLAERLMRIYRLDDICCDAELVVDSAFFKLRRARDRGVLGHIENDNQFVAMLKSFVASEMRDERDRARARKRRGPAGWHERADRAQADLAEFLARAEPPESLFLARETYERLHALLGDPVHQEILAMRFEEYTVEEIAHRLNLNVRTIKRKIHEIREKYLDIQDD